MDVFHQVDFYATIILLPLLLAQSWMTSMANALIFSLEIIHSYNLNHCINPTYTSIYPSITRVPLLIRYIQKRTGIFLLLKYSDDFHILFINQLKQIVCCTKIDLWMRYLLISSNSITGSNQMCSFYCNYLSENFDHEDIHFF